MRIKNKVMQPTTPPAAPAVPALAEWVAAPNQRYSTGRHSRRRWEMEMELELELELETELENGDCFRPFRLVPYS